LKTDDSPVRDAGLIAAAQKVEHYEISGYGSARTHAELLGNEEAARLLEETLNEEKETDQKLNELAQTVNMEADEDSEDMDMEDEEEETAAPAKASGRGGSKSGAKTKSAGSSRNS